ncbi:hypothetical protein G7054_g13806 [Neopestalotiopsis clavispora]|nr:hypothetical protein G7054_g13806 [Neopestalotiopsis clavispora]
MYAHNMGTNYPEITDDSESHSAAAWSYADPAAVPSNFASGPDLLPYSANQMQVPAYVFPSELISAVRRSQQTYGGAVDNTSATPWMNYMSHGAWSEASPPMGHAGGYSTEPRGVESSWYTTQAPPAYNVYSANPGNNSLSLSSPNMGQWNARSSPGANSSAFSTTSSVPLSSAQSPFHSSEASWLREVDGAFDRNPDGSSIHETGSIYLAENERYYHRYKEGSYWFPNDAEEQDRLDFQHAMFRIMTGDKLALSPVKAPANVMDVGTGTGIWAIEFAKENPDSQVYGMDLSAIQPAKHGASNCNFDVDDAEEEWTGYPMFDYVHLRFTNVCFYNPKAVMEHAFKNLNPGGWIEYQDYDIEFKQANPHYKGTALIRWYQTAIRGALMKGRNILISRQYKQMLQEIGFVDVYEEKIQIPVDGLRGPCWKMMRAAGLSPQEIDASIAEVRSELSDEKNNNYCFMTIVWGRKP